MNNEKIKSYSLIRICLNETEDAENTEIKESIELK